VEQESGPVAIARRAVKKLLHQQHLPCAFDGASEPPLVMGWKTSVFARQNSSLIGDVFAQEIHVLRIQIGDD